LRPVAASRATTFSPGVVRYIVPSTTIGVHSIVEAGFVSASPVWKIQATSRSFTFPRWI
jgi:hypothetical protein